MSGSIEPNDFRRIVVVDIETVTIDPADAKGALDALTGRIVCIGMMIDDAVSVKETVLIDPDERRILEQFWEAVKPTDVLVGHNILEFDLPFIRQRSWILNVRPSRHLDLRKYYTGDVVDTMQLWTNWGYKKGVTLEKLGGALACGSKTGHGTDVAHWWANRDLKSIGEYCMEDVRLTYRVYRRLQYLPPELSVTASAASPEAVLV